MERLRFRVGDRIRLLREAHGLTQEQLAGASGTSKRTLLSIEKGYAATNLDLLEAIAHQLGVEPWELLRPAAIASPTGPTPEQLDALERGLEALPEANSRAAGPARRKPGGKGSA